MGSITVIKNTPIEISLRDDITDNGWTVQGGYAIHSGCNSGLIKNLAIPTLPGETYTVTYVIEGYSNGGVYVIVGGENGINQTSNGTFTEEIVANDNSGVMFYSDGNLKVGLLKVAKGTVEAITFAFNEHYKKWVQYLSYQPEFMLKMVNSFFIAVNGELWEQNVNETRNNFCGVQYPSMVRFIVNPDPDIEKQWYNLRINGTGDWFAPELITPKSDLFPNGMRSRLKKNNLSLINNTLWADILRDMKDPNFAHITNLQERELTALFEGRELQGKYLEVLLQNNLNKEFKLLSVDTYYTDVFRTK